MKPEFKPEFKLEPPSPKRKSPKEETLPVIYSVRMVRFPQVAISLAVKTRNWGTLVKIEKLEQSNIAKKQIAKKFNYLTLGPG